MNKLLKVFVITILVLCTFFVFVACNSDNNIMGKYYEEQGDGTLNADSWIELKNGGKWQDDEGEAGTYKLDGQNIIFYQDGEELFDGTVVDGVLTIDNVVFRKTQASDNGNDNINKEYDITLSQNIEAAGTVAGGGKYIVGAEQTITATTNIGYTWVGWHEEETKVSTGSELTYTFTMPAENKAYEARWSVNSYTVTATKNIDTAGTVTGDGSKEYGTTVTVTATTNIGYTWLGWYAEDTKVSTDNELIYSFTMPAENKAYEARWSINSYTVTVEQNTEYGGTVSSGGSKEYDSTVTLTATTNDGYTWVGWHEEETKVSTGSELTYTFTMPAENKTFIARWMVCPIILEQNLSEAGTVFGIEGATAIGAETTITATTNDGYTWLGWFEGGKKVSIDDELTYTFVMPPEGNTFEAKWALTEQGNYDIDGYTQIGNFIWFGEYPQTIKAESVTIIGNQDDRGYYLGDDEYYYAKVVADPLSNDYVFSTGTTITSDAIYYFKVEPIKWRILSESNGETVIICESIIANKRYHASSNNYMNSEIRAWLNNEFYNAAFSGLQQALIEVTEVDNSVYSTGYSNNQYVCDNTFDNIFLPSYREMVNSSYGFSSEYSDYDTARARLTSDYSRSTGVWLDNEISYYGNGFWWLRSPTSSSYSYNARYINEYGYVSSSYHVDSDSFGVVPMMNIKLK